MIIDVYDCRKSPDFQMNSTIFVQPPNAIPVDPNDVQAPVVETPPKAKSVAAVVRPVPRDSGLEGSLRMDAGSAKPGTPHIRSNQLEDYVNWLREKIDTDRIDELKRQGRSAPADDQSESIRTGIPLATTVEHHSEPAIENVAVSMANPATETVETVHSHHVSYADSDSFFSSIATDESGSEPPQPSNLNQAAVPPADLPKPTLQPPKPVRGYSTKLFERIDSAHPEIIMPTHVSFPVESPLAVESSYDDASETEPIIESITAEDSESLVSSVSKAIASVLTDQADPALDSKSQTHFESDIHASFIETIVSRSSVVPADQMPKPTTISFQQVETVTAPTQMPTNIDEGYLTGSGPTPIETPERDSAKWAASAGTTVADIPTSVAAWDVEDFRWPAVTNRMIISGGEAIEQLADSVFDMIDTGQQRIGITGVGRGEGTSSIAISLARWSAACGKKVLVVDADIASPTLGSDIGLAPNLSWINAVSQSLPTAEVIVRSQKTNLCVMPMSKMVSRVTWPRFIFDNLGELLESVRSHFDLVILDIGPASQLLAELSQPELLIDGTLLVHDGSMSPEFNKTKNRLDGFGIKKLMIAQNRAHNNQANVA